MNYLAMIGPWQWIIIIIALIILLFPIIALIDILKSEFSGNNKITWVLLILFLNLVGVILYYALGRRQKVKRDLV